MVPPLSDRNCASNFFTSVAPLFNFTLRVDCPSPCLADSESRVKVVARTKENDLPSWHGENGCRSSPHVSSVLSPICTSPVNNCTLSGGSRQDYKEFGTSSPLKFVNGYTHSEKMNFKIKQDYDLCFCHTACSTTDSNWFKVGENLFFIKIVFCKRLVVCTLVLVKNFTSLSCTKWNSFFQQNTCC